MGGVTLEFHPAVPPLAFTRGFGHVFQPEAGVEHHVFAVGGVLGVSLDVHGAAGHHGTQVAGAKAAQAARTDLLHADAGDHVAFVPRAVVRGGLGVLAGEVVHLLMQRASVQARVPRVRTAGAQVAAWLGEAVGIGRVLAGNHGIDNREGIEVFLIDPGARRMDFQRLVRLARHAEIATDVIDQNQAVLAVRMFEEPRYAPVLHEAGDEGVVALVALGAVDPPGVFRHVEPALNRKGVCRQDLFDDLDVGAVLEDAAVPVLGGDPQPGTQGQSVDKVPPFGAQVAGAVHYAADLTRAGTHAACHPGAHAIQFDANGQLAPVHLAQVEVAFRAVEVVGLVRRLQFDVVFEQAADAFLAIQAYEGKGGLSEEFRQRRTRHGDGAGGKERRSVIQVQHSVALNFLLPQKHQCSGALLLASFA
ncbi:hypothetical protein D3C72_975000 [compost metagenome]